MFVALEGCIGWKNCFGRFWGTDLKTAFKSCPAVIPSVIIRQRASTKCGLQKWISKQRASDTLFDLIIFRMYKCRIGTSISFRHYCTLHCEWKLLHNLINSMQQGCTWEISRYSAGKAIHVFYKSKVALPRIQKPAQKISSGLKLNIY